MAFAENGCRNRHYLANDGPGGIFAGRQCTDYRRYIGYSKSTDHTATLPNADHL